MKHYFRVKNSFVKQRAINYIMSLPDDGDFEVVVQPYDPKRSIDQNRLAHLVVNCIQEQVYLPTGDGHARKFSFDAWWLQLKKNFFEPEILELPDGSFIEQEPRSRDKKTKRFKHWIDYLFQFAAEEGVVIPEEELHDITGRDYG